MRRDMQEAKQGGYLEMAGRREKVIARVQVVLGDEERSKNMVEVENAVALKNDAR
jgi:hypothetical protein